MNVLLIFLELVVAIIYVLHFLLRYVIQPAILALLIIDNALSLAVDAVTVLEWLCVFVLLLQFVPHCKDYGLPCLPIVIIYYFIALQILLYMLQSPALVLG